MPSSKSAYDPSSGAPSPVVKEEHIEYGFIGKLQSLKYEYRPDIRDRAALERNFREKFEALNRVHLSNGEFTRLLDEIVTPDVFTASRKLRERETFTRDDGTPLNYTLVNLKDWCKNSFEVVNQLRINTDYSHHRYDVLILINGVPCVQIELKTLGIVECIHQNSGNGYIWHTTGSGKTLTSFKASTLLKDSVDGLHAEAVFVVEDAASRSLGRHDWADGRPLAADEALRFVITWLQAHLSGDRIVAAGHRVMLGGVRFDTPVRIDDEVLAYLDSLCAMEPSHQPFNVSGLRTVAALMPGLAQVACFDSSFHRTLPETARAYPLPKQVRNAGIRHWGYHGLSCEYIAGQMRELQPAARRVIVAHLGGGSSLCAMLDGRSVETSMGFGGLSGLPMATRSGDVPPEALLYLLKSGLFDVASLETMLYERSGLLGLSGTSGDMRALQDSAEPGAVAAVKQFVHAMTKYVGAYAAVLGGLDALVFTGGIGEHSHQVRAALCRQLASLGLVLDEGANRTGDAVISAPEGRVSVRVIATNEELVIARHTLALVDSAADGR